ncbi:hypothetical protein [Pontibacter sp. BAB1700]|uniref:hypothetical protein n=1 Tax=Pontibacter sp. BAB1700 TaxID=1144253 RepID=UPI00026BDDAF|nr:hypothetical protein [Pontibacter sp. BAB1700]EJF09513.1 hypothetical protein O71_14611 [Pontibacter sp. BAB1700]
MMKREQEKSAACSSAEQLDSSTSIPSNVINYNHIYFHGLEVRGDYIGHVEGHIKPGSQLLYVEVGLPHRVKAVDYDQLYIYAVEHYEIDNDSDGFTLFFRCKRTKAMYTLFFPNSLLNENQNDVESGEYENYAWKDITSEHELNQKKGWIFLYNTRYTKLDNLGF